MWEARRRERARATFGTHEELAEHARRLGAARPLSILRASGLASQRRSILAEAGGACGALLDELADPSGALVAGRLVFPVEELARLGLTPALLGPHGPPDALEVLVHEVLELPRAELRKAWGLVADLGPWRGRIAAAWLRDQWGQLQRLRRAGADLFHTPSRSQRPQKALAWVVALCATAPPSGLGAWPSPGAR